MKLLELSQVIAQAYLPALDIIKVNDSSKARVMILAIGLQESLFKYRRQMGMGPAMGFWQFERGGGVKGVLNHRVSRDKALALCAARGVTPDNMSVWLALENDDVLAAGFARLLLLTDPKPLPEIGMVQTAWNMYQNNWRPGKPHPINWAGNYAEALEEIQ